MALQKKKDNRKTRMISWQEKQFDQTKNLTEYLEDKTVLSQRKFKEK